MPRRPVSAYALVLFLLSLALAGCNGVAYDTNISRSAASSSGAVSAPPPPLAETTTAESSNPAHAPSSYGPIPGVSNQTWGSVLRSVPGMTWFSAEVNFTDEFVDGDVDIWVNWTYPNGQGLSPEALWASGYAAQPIEGPFKDRACFARTLLTIRGDSHNVQVAAAAAGSSPEWNETLPTGATAASGADSIIWNHIFPGGRATAISHCGTDAATLRMLVMEPYSRTVIPATISGHWKNAEVSFAFGNSTDVFSYHADDARGTYVAGSAAGYTVAAGGPVAIDVLLGRPNRTVVFAYCPDARVGVGGSSLDGKASYSRPNGTTQILASGDYILEVSSQVGQWSFRYAQSATEPKVRQAILFGSLAGPS